MARYIQLVLDNSGVSGTAFPVEANTTAGNTLICTVGNAGGGNLTSISDSQGNTWTVDAKTTAGVRNVALASAYLTTALTTSDTITMTATITGQIAVYEFSAIRKTSPFDKSASATAGAGTSLATGSTATLSNANETVVTALAANVPGTITAPGGYTEHLPVTVNSNLDFAEKDVNATTAVSATWSWTNSVVSAVIVGTYIDDITVSVSDSITITESVKSEVTNLISISDSITIAELTILQPLTNILVSNSISTTEFTNIASTFDVHRQPDVYQDGAGMQVV